MLYETILYNEENIFEEFNKITAAGPMDTSSVTVGTVPEEVYFSGDLLLMISNICANFEYVNMSHADSADLLKIYGFTEDDDNIVLVKDDGSIHALDSLEYINKYGE